MSNESTKSNVVVSTNEVDIFSSLKSKKSTLPIELKNETKIKLSTLDTKSKMIRFLAKDGYKTAQIANILNIRYQHVFNVLNTIHKS